MKRVAICGVLLGTLLSPLLARAQEAMHSEVFGVWKMEYSNLDGKGACILYGRASDQIRFGVIALTLEATGLSIEDLRWNLPERTTGKIEFRFDGANLMARTFSRSDSTLMVSSSPPKDRSTSEFLAKLAASKILDVWLPNGSRFSFNAEGAGLGSIEFAKCQQQWAGKIITAGLAPWSTKNSPNTTATVATPPPPPLPPLPPPPLSSAPASPPKEKAASVAAKVPPPPSSTAPNSEGKSISGSGVVVDSRGRIVTNEHVVRGCRSVTVRLPGDEARTARVVAASAADDIALIRAENPYPDYIALSSRGARLGEPIFVYGFPLASALATSGNFTLGNVTALAGLRDDYRELQISVPIQPGNSGGPVIAQDGGLVGIVSSKLDALKVVKAIGDVPQNVNFAIKASLVIAFLEANAVTMRPSDGVKPMSAVEAAELLKRVTVQIRCRS